MCTDLLLKCMFSCHINYQLQIHYQHDQCKRKQAESLKKTVHKVRCKDSHWAHVQ